MSAIDHRQAGVEATMRRRTILVIAGITLASAGIVARLVQLQVVDHRELQGRAQRQHEVRIEVRPMRGAILDRNGEELAVSLATQTLYVHPRRVEDKERAASLLAPVLRVSRAKLLARLRSDKSFEYLHRALEPAVAAAVRGLDLPVGGGGPFGFHDSSQRHYPHGRLGVHVIGFAGVDGMGVEGIEKAFDEALTGETSLLHVLRDARGGSLTKEIRPSKSDPRDVVLTLDRVVQHITERELDRGMAESGAKAGSAVVIDPATGDVLALANRPTIGRGGYTEASIEQRSNRAVWHQFEPGSTFKIVTMAAALEHGEVRPSDSVDCENGSLQLTAARPIKDSSPHGRLTAVEVMEKSSNIGMVKLVGRLDRELLWETIDRFSFGKPLGLEVSGEIPGTFKPFVDWERDTFASLAFGHEIGVTVMQMATAFAVVANDGLLIPPRFVRGLRDAEGRLEPAKRPGPQRVIRADVSRELTAMLKGAVLRGTGKAAGIDGYSVAGKTGTAQKFTRGKYSHEDYVASFGGFAPVDSPRLVALVVLDTPEGLRHQGGQVAAPVFSRIMNDALLHLRARPDATRTARVTTPGRSPATSGVRSTDAPDSRTGLVPDVVGLSLREAVSRLSASGCRPQPRGAGVVVEQQPRAGSTIPPRGAVCRVRLADNVSVRSPRASG